MPQLDPIFYLNLITGFLLLFIPIYYYLKNIIFTYYNDYNLIINKINNQ